MSELMRTVRFRPAYDCISVQPCTLGSDACTPGAGGSHGRHSVDMTMFLSGPEGAVQFKVFTGWMLDASPPNAWGHVMAADLGYHSRTPLYEDQADLGPCEWVGKHCYYDGSTLNAETPWTLLREKGDEAVWEYLTDYYAEVFARAEAAS